MTNLSPATEAVLHAVTLKRYDVPYQACPKSIDQIRSDVAAALRAAADQVVPEPNDTDKALLSLAAIRNHCKVRDRFLAIADELDNTAQQS